MPKKSTKKSAKSVKQADSPTIKMDKDFRELFLPHTPKENARLEASILKEGCREALIVWKETGKLIDGYHRYDICKKHNIKHKVRLISFKDKEAVKLWMWENQTGRRNVTTQFQQIEVVLKIKDAIAAKAKANQKAAGGAVSKKVYKPIRTDKVLGEEVGVSHVLVGRVEFILEKHREGIVSEEEINDLRSGKVKPSRIYKQYYAPKPSATTDKEKPLFDFDDQPTQEHNKPDKVLPAFLPTEEEFNKRKGKTLADQVSYVYTILDKLADKIAEEHPTIENRITIYEQMRVWANIKKGHIVKQQKQE